MRRFLFKLVLEDAILREEKAYGFYESAHKKAKRPEAAELLDRLRAEELRHRLKLEELQKQRDVGELLVEEGEEVEILERKPYWPLLSGDSSTADILLAALEKEKQAVHYYGALSKRSSLRAVRDLFALLSREESRHVGWVQGMLERELS